MEWAIIFRSLVSLSMLVTALAIAIVVYRRTSKADMILILLSLWFVHGIVFCMVTLATFIMFDPYPRDLALAVNWWSIILRYQIILALIIVLVRHPRG